MGIPVAGTAVLVLFVILVVCVCLRAKHKTSRYVVVLLDVMYLLV